MEIMPFGRNRFPDDVEWWEIERREQRGRTTYGIRVGGERVATGHRSVFEAINVALAVLHQREAAEDAAASALLPN